MIKVTNKDIYTKRDNHTFCGMMWATGFGFAILFWLIYGQLWLRVFPFTEDALFISIACASIVCIWAILVVVWAIIWNIFSWLGDLILKQRFRHGEKDVYRDLYYDAEKVFCSMCLAGILFACCDLPSEINSITVCVGLQQFLRLAYFVFCGASACFAIRLLSGPDGLFSKAKNYFCQA